MLGHCVTKQWEAWKVPHSLLKPLVKCQRDVILLLQPADGRVHFRADDVYVHVQVLHHFKEWFHAACGKLTQKSLTSIHPSSSHLYPAWLIVQVHVISTFGHLLQQWCYMITFVCHIFVTYTLRSVSSEIQPLHLKYPILGAGSSGHTHTQ